MLLSLLCLIPDVQTWIDKEKARRLPDCSPDRSTTCTRSPSARPTDPSDRWPQAWFPKVILVVCGLGHAIYSLWHKMETVVQATSFIGPLPALRAYP